MKARSQFRNGSCKQSPSRQRQKWRAHTGGHSEQRPFNGACARANVRQQPRSLLRERCRTSSPRATSGCFAPTGGQRSAPASAFAFRDLTISISIGNRPEGSLTVVDVSLAALRRLGCPLEKLIGPASRRIGASSCLARRFDPGKPAGPPRFGGAVPNLTNAKRRAECALLLRRA